MQVVENVWKPEVVNLLVHLWREGVQTKLIADKLASEMSVAVTRNAVIGKVHRMGLPLRERPEKKPPAPRQPRAKRQRFIEKVACCVDLFEVPVEQRKTFMQLKSNDCRWPVGDPGEEGFYFCGGVSEPDKPYCAAHCRIAYRPRA